MRTQIPVPSKGDGLRASWGAAVASRVNELCAMAPSGVLQREGFGGIGAQPLPANLRNRVVMAPVVAGCWTIAAAEPEDPAPGAGEGEGEGEDEPVFVWQNQFIMLGAELVIADVDDDPTTHAGKFVAVLVVDNAAAAISIQEFDTAAALAAATNDSTKFTIPLGKLNIGGTGYEIDMRFIPHAGSWDAYIAPDDDDDSPSAGGGSS